MTLSPGVAGGWSLDHYNPPADIKHLNSFKFQKSGQRNYPGCIGKDPYLFITITIWILSGAAERMMVEA
jgi:hypothetical protein